MKDVSIKEKFGRFILAALSGKASDIQACKDLGIEMKAATVTDGGFIVKDADLQKCRDLGIELYVETEDGRIVKEKDLAKGELAE